MNTVLHFEPYKYTVALRAPGQAWNSLGVGHAARAGVVEVDPLGLAQ
jgi:hypothetical protein